MPTIDLTRYIVASAGTWTDPAKDRKLFDFTLADTMSPGRLMLRWSDDFVALTGPLRVRVTVQAENMTVPLAYVGNLVRDTGSAGTVLSPGVSTDKASKATLLPGVDLTEAAARYTAAVRDNPQASTIYSYMLDVPAGQAWPFSLSEQSAKLRSQYLNSSRYEQLGNNLGFRVLIEAAFAAADCTPATSRNDLPCDFAVANQPNTGRFFPSACEPCEGSFIGMPPSDSVSLVTPPAAGGCVRTRFFNGMMITREDLETEQRYQRLKSRLHNRAAGAGVVWGLNVALQGNQVCVMPGYGVDCCGNDLALTTIYAVDIAALLADPGAVSIARQNPWTRTGLRQGSSRMNLLLEYVECPAEPRPVHADPCAPEASSCEMSRIRESVRLRLVPPCDYNAAKESAPIQKFLDQVRELRKRYPLETGTGDITTQLAPFQLRVAITGTDGNTRTPVLVRPSSDITRVQLQSDVAVQNLTIDVIQDTLSTFVAGSISGVATDSSGKTITGVVQPPDPIDLSLAKGFGSSALMKFNVSGSSAATNDAQLEYKVKWQAQNLLAGEDDSAPSGDIDFVITLSSALAKENTFKATVGSGTLNLDPSPCAGEPCSSDPGSRLGGGGDCSNSAAGAYYNQASYGQASYNQTTISTDDPTPFLPWLHMDPAHESTPGDPKVLALAALGGWLGQMLARERAATKDEIASPRREIAQGIYRVAWLLLFGVPRSANTAALGRTLDQLLKGWCDELLWKGPQCPCDPHGVVIGCATVDGGTIQKIDPFGGRRYVMHYPILEHWGAQFGLAPPDITFSRFFSKLCCLAGLAPLNVDKPDVPAALVPLGTGYLAVGEPTDIAKALPEQVQIVERREAGLPEMIASVLVLLSSTKSAGAPGQTSYRALSLNNFVAAHTVLLIMPV